MANSVVERAMQQGKALAAADNVLIEPEPGKLVDRNNQVLFALQQFKESKPDKAAEALLHLGLNNIGAEGMLAGYALGERLAALRGVYTALEGLNPDIVTEAVSRFLDDMASVNAAGGGSLSGLWAERIRPRVFEEKHQAGEAFLKLMYIQLQECVYWQMFSERMCKFGNDFARGLRWLRFAGFCQVSTNPVLAWRAYLEDELLKARFRAEAKGHAEWLKDPHSYARQMALEATLLAIEPNMEVFRPMALLTGLGDFIVSLQLNPEISHDAAASIEDAENAFAWAKEKQTAYDGLLGVEEPGALNPCIVFKVAANHPASIRITRLLNRRSIPTNITVDYTVVQELMLFIEALKGKAEAIREGLPIARGYTTNMGGRLVSHLREQYAVNIFVQLAKKNIAVAFGLLKELADALGVDPAIWSALAKADIETKARVICSYQYLKSLAEPAILKAAELIGKSRGEINRTEQDLRMAGTLVVRRVWWTFFAPENREKWIVYLADRFGISKEQAQGALESIDCLPASKRIPEDTLLTLGYGGMTQTEFPNFACAVQRHVEERKLAISHFANSIATPPRLRQLERLEQIFDFRRAYDLTPGLRAFLQDKVGIDVTGWGTQGVGPKSWPAYGAPQKTSCEFQDAFLQFVEMCMEMCTGLA